MHKISNPNLSHHLHHLKNSIGDIEASMRHLDRIIHGAPQKTSRSRMVRGHREKAEPKSLLEQLAKPIVGGIFSGLLGSATGNASTAMAVSQKLAGALTGSTSS